MREHVALFNSFATSSLARDTHLLIYDPLLAAIMPNLDTHGIIAAAQLAVYVLVCICTVLLLFRYAFTRDSGWLFLFFFGLSTSDILQLLCSNL